MKILIADKCIYDVGGVQNIITTLANNLVDNNEVTMLSVIKNAERPHFKYDQNVKIKFLLDFTEHNLKQYKKKNLKYYILRIKEELQKKYKLKSLIKKNSRYITESDVIIFGRIDTAILFFKCLGDKFKGKNVIVRDSMNLKFYDENLKNKMKYYFPKYVSNFITSSEECINQYNDFFDDKVNIKKIYNPLCIIPKKVGSMKNKTIAAVGRMDQQKGFDMLIKIFKKVKNEYPEWKLNIYGDGINKYKLLNLIEEEQLDDSVILKGNSSDIVESLNETSIFAFTSRYEGYANALVEAMSCGLPCISFDFFTGVEDIIDKNMQNGIIVNLKNRDEYFYGVNNEEDELNFYNKIKYLIENEKIAEEIGNEAMNIISSRKIDVIISEWKKIIEGE